MLHDLLQSGRHQFGGRVGFIPTELTAVSQDLADAVDLTGRPGVVGRADRFVQSDAEFADLARRLLGNTWIVETLSDARALAEDTRGQNFVTRLAGRRRHDLCRSQDQ
jgi:chromosome segregation protein